MSNCERTKVPKKFCTCIDCQKPAPPAAATPQATDPYNVECMDCRHVWVGFYLPQPLDVVGKIMGDLRCPKCGANATRIAIAQEETL